MLFFPLLLPRHTQVRHALRLLHALFRSDSRRRGGSRHSEVIELREAALGWQPDHGEQEDGTSQVAPAVAQTQPTGEMAVVGPDARLRIWSGLVGLVRGLEYG